LGQRFRLSLGQVACAEKSNEITAIPELLRLVDIKGTIITIDAMGTQKAIAEQIIDSGADYVLALKETRRHCIRQSSTTSMNKSQTILPTRRRAGTPLRKKGHGREEARQLHSDAGAGESARIGNVERLENDRYGDVGVYA